MTDLEGEELLNIQSEIDAMIDSISFDKAFSTWGKTVQTTSITEDIISKYSLLHFEKSIMRNVDNYCDRIGFKQSRKVSLRTSWLTKNCKYGYTHMHNHTSTDITGCYYYKTTGKDGNLYFYNPNIAATSSYLMGGTPSYVDIEPIVGRLLLFPGYLLHAVKTNETDNERISFAFSIIFER